jgi:hypothetical protein
MLPLVNSGARKAIATPGLTSAVSRGTNKKMASVTCSQNAVSLASTATLGNVVRAVALFIWEYANLDPRKSQFTLTIEMQLCRINYVS